MQSQAFSWNNNNVYNDAVPETLSVNATFGTEQKRISNLVL